LITKPTFWLTLILFAMMILAGIASSYVGYFMGTEALKVVTQPDVNSQDIADNQEHIGGEHKGLKIIAEKDILVKVYNYIHAQDEKNQL
jgi:uncharacterized membrane protein